ncbi:MAG: aconitase X [Candidatus Bathyarchaeia archaeon]
MYLTKEEEKILDGEQGWAYEIAMKILVRLGDLFGATRLIPIKSAHVSGVSYKTMGDSVDFLYALVRAGGRAQAPATLNPSSFDPEYLVRKIPREYREGQLRIIDLYKKMGFELTLTCTPYYISKPRRGWHLAWSESSAVMYANTVLKSWTNREGGPSALAAALIGKTPNHGMHQAENRQPNILIEVESNPVNETEFGTLGIHVGKFLKEKIPLFTGLSNYTEEGLKQLGAGMATTGMTSMFHYHELPQKIDFETVSVESKDIQNTIENLSTTSATPDLIFIGCPHCSLKEIRKAAEYLKGKKVKTGTELWVCTSQHVKGKAKKHVDIIEKAGGHVLCDTCPIVAWTKNLGIDAVMTNSAKAAYYAPTYNEVGVTLAPLKQCIDTACFP